MPFNSMPPPDSGASPVGSGVMTRSRWATMARNSALDPDLQNKLDALTPTKQIDDCHHIREQRHEGDQQMADACGNVPAVPNRPMDNITTSRSLMNVTPLSRESTYVTTAEDQLTHVTTAEDQPIDEEMVADSWSDNEEDEQPDFSRLPLYLWLTVFSFLNQRDRLALSVTCRKLYDVCMTSSILWKKAVIHIGGNKPDEEVRLTETDRSVLRAHRHQMTDVTFHMNCSWSLSLDESSYRLLFETASLCPLKNLEVRTDFKHRGSSSLINEPMQDLLHTCFTSPNSSQLCSLKISALDWHNTHTNSGVVEALKNSSFTSSLTHLYIGMIMALSVESVQLWNVIGRFPNLQYLTVPFEHLSDNLLNTFSRLLKEVHFIVNVKDEPKEVSNWPRALAMCPRLIVGLIFVGWPPFNILPRLLPAVVPVSSIRMQDMLPLCGIFQWTLLQLLPPYFVHLQVLQFIYKESASHLEQMLINTINQCPKLNRLYFDGCISSDAVVTLARMRWWRELEFDARCIIFRNSGDRERQLQALCRKVSKLLGKAWKPQSLNNPLGYTQSSGMGVCFQTALSA